MIQNEREYRITSAWLKRFERDVETLEHNPVKPGAPGPIAIPPVRCMPGIKTGAAVGARSNPSPPGAAVGSRGVHPKLHKAKIDASRSQAEDLRTQLAAFDALRSHQISSVTVTGLEGLANALIQARIAAGLTQEELAERLGLKRQQVQRYEATRYATANLERLNAVANALEVSVKSKVAFVCTVK
jgi:DNA-binding XRE family transcriptional regulator